MSQREILIEGTDREIVIEVQGPPGPPGPPGSGGSGGVTSVNGQVGVVVLGAADVGADSAGAAAAAQATASTDATTKADASTAFSVQRINHTGDQLASTISDLTETVQDIVAAFAVAGTHISVTYNDPAGTLTFAVTGLASTDLSDFTEAVQDVMGTTIVGGTGISATYSDVGNSLTLAVSGLNSSSLSDFTEATQDVVGALSGFGGAGLTFTYNDGANTVTLDVNVDGSTIEISGDLLRVKALGITDSHVAAANKDGVAGTASMRTLGTGAQQAAAGNDSRLSDTRTPTDNTVTSAKIVDGSVANADLANMATKTYKGRTSAATGIPEDVPAATVLSDLGALSTASASATYQTLANLDTDSTFAANSDTKYASQKAVKTALATVSGTTIPHTVQTGDYTLALADAGTVVEMNKATAVAVTVPLNSVIAFPVDTIIEIVQLGAGTVTVSGAGGVTILGGSVFTVAQYGVIVLRKDATDTWVVAANAGSAVQVGELGYAAITADVTQVGAGNALVTGMSSTVTTSSRPVMVTMSAQIKHATSGSTITLTLEEDGTTILSAEFTPSAANQSVPVERSIRRFPSGGSHTYRCRVTTVGTGTGTVMASATSPAWVNVIQV